MLKRFVCAVMAALLLMAAAPLVVSAERGEPIFPGLTPPRGTACEVVSE